MEKRILRAPANIVFSFRKVFMNLNQEYIELRQLVPAHLLASLDKVEVEFFEAFKNILIDKRVKGGELSKWLVTDISDLSVERQELLSFATALLSLTIQKIYTDKILLPSILGQTEISGVS